MMKQWLMVAGLMLLMGMPAVRADLKATPGSGAAGDWFAALNGTVKTSGISIQYVTANNTPVNVGDTSLWFDSDVWSKTYINNVWPKQYNWYVAVIVDFGKPVNISRIEAKWSKYNDYAAVPDIYYLADTLPVNGNNYYSTIASVAFASTTGVAPGTWQPVQTTDTGILATPITMSKLILVMYCPDFAGLTRPVAPAEFNIYGSLQGIYANTWYDNLNLWNDPAVVYNTSSDTTLSYNYESCNPSDPVQYNRVMTYLTNAASRGMQVILSCKELLAMVQTGQRTWQDFTNYIVAYDSHSALKGWYLADEPYFSGVSLANHQIAYNIIRQNSVKPVYISFCYTDVINQNPYVYRDAYDIMMFNNYPFEVGDPEYQKLEDRLVNKALILGWKHKCLDATDQASFAGRPMIMVIQAFGTRVGMTSCRLPTYWEERFMCFWSIMQGYSGLSFWAMDFLVQCTATPNEVYPYNGEVWRGDVGLTVCQELNQLNDALNRGPISNGVADNNSAILSNIYKDPQTGQYHLIAVNSSATSSNVIFTLNLPVSMISAVPQWGRAGIPTQIIRNNSISDTLWAYEVRHYALYP